MTLGKCCGLSLLIAFSAAVGTSGQQTAARVSFTLDFPGANPSHYEIVVGSDGGGFYVSNGKFDEQSAPADPEPLPFTLSDNVRRKVFELAERAHYFTGKVDSGRKNIANTGTKTLAYRDPKHDARTTYNYSLLQPIEELTSVFEGLSTTMEFGRRLIYLHKYQKLALDDELKRMQELAKENSLGDVQAIAPVLKDIAADGSVMNISRARALQLLDSAGK
jgi:hypothetical protein